MGSRACPERFMPLMGGDESILIYSTITRSFPDRERVVRGLVSISCEAPQSAGARLEIRERDISARQGARKPCGIRSPGPLDVANEGKPVIFCPQEDAGRVLSFMKGHECGMDAAVTGKVASLGGNRGILRTAAGGSRRWIFRGRADSPDLLEPFPAGRCQGRTARGVSRKTCLSGTVWTMDFMIFCFRGETRPLPSTR